MWFRQNVMIPFLNQYLKDGPPPTIARGPIEVGTNQWKRLPDWPPACMRGCPANLTPLYLAPGARVAFDAPPEKLRRLHFRSLQARHLSRPPQPLAVGAGSTWRTWLADDQRFADAAPTSSPTRATH